MARRIEVSASKTERMVYLGMSNSCELVNNGVARKIAAVEDEEGTEEVYEYEDDE